MPGTARLHHDRAALAARDAPWLLQRL